MARHMAASHAGSAPTPRNPRRQQRPVASASRRPPPLDPRPAAISAASITTGATPKTDTVASTKLVSSGSPHVGSDGAVLGDVDAPEGKELNGVSHCEILVAAPASTSWTVALSTGGISRRLALVSAPIKATGSGDAKVTLNWPRPYSHEDIHFAHVWSGTVQPEFGIKFSYLTRTLVEGL